MIEVQSRVNTIFEMLIAGASRAQIHQYAAGKEPKRQDDGTLSDGRLSWGLSERQIDEYISKANALFAEQSKIERDKEIGKSLTRYNKIYSVSMQAGDRRGALEAEKAKATLLGLNAPSKMAVGGDPTGAPIVSTMTITPESLKKIGDILAKQEKQT